MEKLIIKEKNKNFILNIFKPGTTMQMAAEKAGITRQTGHNILRYNKESLILYNHIAKRIENLLEDIEKELEDIIEYKK